MEPIKKAMLVSITLNEGETLPKGKKISGTAVVDDEEQNFAFTENAKRAKGYTHNPVLFSGDHTTARLQKNSEYRITTMLPSNFDFSKEAVVGLLVDEFKDSLEAIRK